MREYKIDNPYWDAVKDIYSEYDVDKYEYVRSWSWSITSPMALELVKTASNGRIVEMGCGTGYWLYCLSQMGVKCVGYDMPVSTYGHTKKYFPFRHGGPEQLGRFSKAALFLSWPPQFGTMAYDALRAYRGNTLIYIGYEEFEGVTGTDEFFEERAQNWSLQKIFDIPNFYHDRNRLELWSRNI